MNAYIFLGEELGKKLDAVNSVKKKQSGKNISIEESHYNAGETAVSKIADTLQNDCLFADKRIVIVQNAELLKKKEEIDLLVSCIKNSDSGTTLILLSDENKIAAGLENAIPPSNRQVFYEMFEKEKTQWLINFFKNEGCSIEKDAVSVILELVENNTLALKNECLRLINFIKQEKKAGNIAITAEDAEKWLAHNREETPFVLFSRIAQGDLSKALESMSVMLAAKQTPAGILAGLAWCFRRLADYINLAESGYEINFMELKKIGLSSPQAKDSCIAAARRYNAESAQACLALTAEYDLLSRSPVSVMADILMDMYVLKIFKLGK